MISWKESVVTVKPLAFPPFSNVIPWCFPCNADTTFFHAYLLHPKIYPLHFNHNLLVFHYLMHSYIMMGSRYFLAYWLQQAIEDDCFANQCEEDPLSSFFWLNQETSGLLFAKVFITVKFDYAISSNSEVWAQDFRVEMHSTRFSKLFNRLFIDSLSCQALMCSDIPQIARKIKHFNWFKIAWLESRYFAVRVQKCITFS